MLVGPPYLVVLTPILCAFSGSPCPHRLPPRRALQLRTDWCPRGAVLHPHPGHHPAPPPSDRLSLVHHRVQVMHDQPTEDSHRCRVLQHGRPHGEAHRRVWYVSVCTYSKFLSDLSIMLRVSHFLEVLVINFFSSVFIFY